MARRRMKLAKTIALAAVLAAPLAAQSTTPAPPVPTPTPTPTPTPAPGNSVGPAQLRDFNLNGVVTQPAPPATPTPTPSPAPAPASREPVPGTTAPDDTEPPPSTPAPRPPSVAAPDSNPATGAVTVDLPPSTAAPLAPDVSLEPAATAATADEPGAAWWPWLAALLAAALGGGWLWRRRQASGERYAADDATPGAVVAAPVLPRAAPTPTRPAAAPVPAPSPVPPPAPLPDGIFASRLKPELGFELVPVRVDTDAGGGAALTFDLVVINHGSAPARDVLVDVKLVNAGPQVDAEVGRFFQQPAGDGQRVPLIPPMGRVSLRTRAAAAGASLTPLVVAGRKLFVPVVAVNALYRWSGVDQKESSSFLVGRGEAEGGKMAPFRLDLGARGWSDLGVRLHSQGLQR